MGYKELDCDVSYDKIRHLVGRFEVSASDFYIDFKNSEKSFVASEVMGMSKFTRNILGAIDYTFVKEKRIENWLYLHSVLKDFNGLYLKNSIEVVSKYLGMTTEILVSSEIEKDCSLKGQEKILEICKKLGGTEYYNAIGGVELYSHELFRKNGINLSFVKTNNIEYKQYGNEFCPGLSILDVMMFNSPEEIRIFLDDFELVT